MKKYSILFVCMGNICRSPTAEGVFRVIAKNSLPDAQLTIDSAGTIAHHVGENPDRRAVKAARERSYDLSSIISRQVNESDFETFDLIIAMDKENLRSLLSQAKRVGDQKTIDKVKLFLDFSSQAEYREVPDPYYGGIDGFDLVIDLVEDASHGLIEHIRERYFSD